MLSYDKKTLLTLYEVRWKFWNDAKSRFFGNIVDFDIAGESRSAVFGATAYFVFCLPQIGNHVSDWLKQGLKL